MEVVNLTFFSVALPFAWQAQNLVWTGASNVVRICACPSSWNIPFLLTPLNPNGRISALIFEIKGEYKSQMPEKKHSESLEKLERALRRVLMKFFNDWT